MYNGPQYIKFNRYYYMINSTMRLPDRNKKKGRYPDGYLPVSQTKT